MIKTVLNRIISDYFLSNRIGEYEKVLQKAKEKGYEVLSHSDYFQETRDNKIGDRKILLVRHDIDSDPKYVHQWLAIDDKYKVKTSYYFRLCTLDKKAMNAVQTQGGDCGYHYEELAIHIKKNALPLTTDFTTHYEACRALFEENLKKVEAFCGFKIKSIASHGDFINRKIGLPNHKFVTPELLVKNGIDFEGYQTEFVDRYSINIMDLEYPKYFMGDVSPIDALEKEYQIVHLLFHPKNNRTNWWANTVENIRRLREGIVYSFRTKLKNKAK